MAGNVIDVSARHDLVERSAPFLPPDRKIRQAFICKTAPRFAFFLTTYLTGLTMFWVKYRCVAVTQDAIYVLESSKLSGGAMPQSLLGTLPRRTQLGPVSGRWGQLNLWASAIGSTSAFIAKSPPRTMKPVLHPGRVGRPPRRP